MSAIEDRNFYMDPRVRFRSPRHESWRIDEKRMLVYVTLPEWCPTHGEGEQDDHPECLVCSRIAKLLKEPAKVEGDDEERGAIDVDALGPEADEIAVPFEWCVCGLCNGKGKHTNPSIDCGGLTSEDFDEDPDFRESYMRGDYDVTCSECSGRRVVPKLTPRTADERAFVKALNKQEEDDAAHEHECRAERAMGA